MPDGFPSRGDLSCPVSGSDPRMTRGTEKDVPVIGKGKINKNHHHHHHHQTTADQTCIRSIDRRELLASIGNNVGEGRISREA
ncbi:hypothetical protein ZHAS_00004429 [Anopheles sinensis]|uniref:Uncharacterized protein n=1 Tax=Anopheles sinensis TaxID=74873 RepID=A0A084VGX2_ANOSI|nr:hypothetical protein ZHAS_00004429 [Anopheles sinensis]